MLRDATTGIYARSALKERLQEEVARARLTGEPLSLLLIDLDYFKSVNDAFGHSRGDAVLLEWVGRLSAAIRSSDLPFRYGGDEFVVLLPNTTAVHASGLAFRLLAGTQTVPFEGDPPLTLSLSIGAASFPEDADTSEALFALADHRLFEAKRQGRGRVVDSTATAGGSFRIEETVRLVERDDALAVLQQFLAELTTRGRSVLSVEGVRGAGRSRFLHEALGAAELLGLATLSLRGQPAHRGVPYATLREAIPDVEALAVVVAPESVLFSASQGGGAEQAPLLVVLDDASDADRATLELLRRTLETSGPTPVSLICAVDSSRRFQLPQLERPIVTTIEMRPLTLDAVRVWLRTLLRWEPPNAFLSWLHRETRGLPKFLHSGLVHLQERGLLVLGKDGWTVRPAYAGIQLRDVLGAGTEEPAHNLPAPSTTFVGRTREIETARTLLGRSRLLTLTGPGGIGKTRLSLELCSEVLDQYPDGVWLVELAAVGDPGHVVSTVTAALNLAEESGGSPLATLTGHLQHRVLLLLLDNCEHVIDAAASLAASLLRSCQHLKILATSRETLGVPGEQIFRVPPLSLPGTEDLAADSAAPAGRPDRSEALSLFRQRALLVRPDFEIDAENVAHVTQICRQLDGIPLAIELAAARTSVLPVSQIALRLDDRFRLLRGGSRTALPRQQTLKALIDWSYNLLDDEEQRVLRALSVFSGGWTLAAAEALFAGHDRGASLSLSAMPFPDPESDALDLLTRLANKSLVQVEVFDAGTREPRYRLLETIRQYARDRLLDAGEADWYRGRHLDHYLHVGTEAEAKLRGPVQREWLDRLETEHDNLRAALDWARVERPAAGLRLAAALTRFWLVRGHRTEGRERFSVFLALNRAEEQGQVYQQALFGAGLLALYQHDSQASVEYMEAAADLAQRLGDARAHVMALCQLGYSRHQFRDLPGAAAAWEAGLAGARRLDDPWVLGFALRAWAFHVQLLGNDVEALSALEEGLGLLQETGDEWMIANLLWRTGLTRLWHLGDYQTAARHFRQSHNLLAALRDPVGVSHNLGDLGWSTYFQGDVAGCRRLFEELLALTRERNDGPGYSGALYNLGKLAQLEGEYEAAEEYLREVLQLDANDFSVAHWMPWSLQTLALIDLHQGREERALERLQQAIHMFQTRRDELGQGICIRTYARLRAPSSPVYAAMLFGCASAIIEAAGWRSSRLLHPDDPEDVATLQLTLGEAGFTAAWNSGRELTAKAALELEDQHVQEGQRLVRLPLK